MGNLKRIDRSSNASRRVRAKRSRNRGVSLIEVIVALAILGFGMLGMAAAQISAFRFSDSRRASGPSPTVSRIQQLEIFQSMSTTSLEAAFGLAGTYPTDPLNPDRSGSRMMHGADGLQPKSWAITPDTPGARRVHGPWSR